MVAWTGLEHFRVGRFNPPPPAIEPDDYVVRSLNKEQYFKWPRGEEISVNQRLISYPVTPNRVRFDFAY
ncbi:BnaC04g04160D [Brassica napus]|uniref:BnaC04g04160D protein n=1 Tax=Brassica napus TaxID=3708 RepID=A0A078G0B8_BRANA|nr:BnaC04g04160D [Brassica napus]